MPLLDWLTALRHNMADDQVLNVAAAARFRGAQPDPERLGLILRDLKALATAAISDGFDYAALADSQAYHAYRRYVTGLRSFDPGKLSTRKEQLAFWINLYNGLVLDAVVQWGVRRSVRDVAGFFWRAAYNLGGLRYSANDIENGVLRANSHHPAIPGAPFGRSDPRRRYSLDRVDPRVHFALVCASRSCPAVTVYSPQRVDEQLDWATRSFIRGGGVEVDPVLGRIRLSRLFQWYAHDFGAKRFAVGDKQPLLRFVAGCLDPVDAKLVLARRRWSVVFSAYDWSLNGAWLGTRTHAASE